VDLILPTREGGWPVIYCDPPWNFKTYSKKGLGKSPEQHYPCMTDGDLSALPIAGLAADDCAMFMWATFPKLPARNWRPRLGTSIAKQLYRQKLSVLLQADEKDS